MYSFSAFAQSLLNCGFLNTSSLVKPYLSAILAASCSFNALVGLSINISGFCCIVATISLSLIPLLFTSSNALSIAACDPDACAVSNAFKLSTSPLSNCSGLPAITSAAFSKPALILSCAAFVFAALLAAASSLFI